MTVSERAASHIVIHASAGSGKTFRLSNRYITLLARGERAERILATTFTRNAAAEILHRVVSRLRAAASSAEAAAELAELIDAPLSRERAFELLERVLRRLHRLEIGTLDSFFARVCRAFSLELELPPGWRILETAAEEELRALAVRDLIGGQKKRDLVTLVRLLSKGHVSRSVTAQIHSIVADLHDLYLEAPPEAWKARRRAGKLGAEELARVIEDLRSAAAGCGKTLGGRILLDTEKALAAEWEDLLTKGPAGKVADGSLTYSRKALDARLVDLYRPLVEHAAAVVLETLARRTAGIRTLLESYDACYRRLKHGRRALAFQDLPRALAGRSTFDDLETLYYRLDGRIAHLLLDEFQDTSLLQWQALRRIAEEVTACGDGSRTFFCVGDEKQAIYGWRGGKAELFEEVDRLPGVVREPLAKSWRSAPAIVETVNRVFEGLPAHAAIAEKYRPAAREWHRGFEHHTTARADLPGHARLVTAPDAAGEPRDLVTWARAADEVARLREECPGRTIGVLVRRNRAVAWLIQELRRRGVRASEEGGIRLDDSPFVLAVLSLIRLADHPGDTVARFHAATSPLGPVAGLTRETGDREALRVSRRLRRRLLEDGYGRTIAGWIEELAPACDARSIRRLLQLVDAAHRYDGEATLRPADFVRHVARLRVEDPSQNAVRVMTLHGSKGLEFDIVVLPELDQRLVGQWPPALSSRPSEDSPSGRVSVYFGDSLARVLPELASFHDEYYARQLRDSLSLLYVGMTRAARAIHMIIAPAASNERNVPGTFAGILRSALAPDDPAGPGEVLFERGDPRWHAGERRPEARSRNGGDGREAPAIVPRLLSSAARRRGLARESPSSLEGGRSVKLSDVFRLDRKRAFERGSVLHRWLESIEWLEDGETGDDLVRRRGERDGLEPEAAGALLRELREMLRAPEVRRVFDRNVYRDRAAGEDVEIRAERERPFAVRDEDRILTGTFDRLVTVRSGGRPSRAEVVDFKTDLVPADDGGRIDFLTEIYRPQMEAYRRAAARITGLEPERVSARLVFLSAGVARGV